MCSGASPPQPMWQGRMAGNLALDALTKPLCTILTFAKIFDFGAQGQLRSGRHSTGVQWLRLLVAGGAASRIEDWRSLLTRPISTRSLPTWYSNGGSTDYFDHRCARRPARTWNGAPSGRGITNGQTQRFHPRPCRRPGTYCRGILCQRSRTLFQTEIREVCRRLGL